MRPTSKPTRVPPVQPITTISLCSNLPLSQTKPVRATTWLIPRFNPVAPPGRVQSAGQHHASSVVRPATQIEILCVRSHTILRQTHLYRLIVFGRRSEEKIPEGISAGNSPRSRWQPRSETPTQTPSSRHLRSVPPLRVRLPHSLSFTACRIHATGW
jgi:hypothetical protein